jgi:hypothetical protein
LQGLPDGMNAFQRDVSLRFKQLLHFRDFIQSCPDGVDIGEDRKSAEQVSAGLGYGVAGKSRPYTLEFQFFDCGVEIVHAVTSAPAFL